jgi:hypothetical protein
MSAHSRVSPSNKLATICPNSVWKRERIEARNQFLKHKITYQSGIQNREQVLAALDVDTAPAELGTLMHNIRENVINGKGKITTHDLFNEHNIDDDIAEGRLQEQADWIRDKLSTCVLGGVETKIANLGTASGGRCDAWWLEGNTLDVEDLKSGRIEVVAEENRGMMRYACGILDELGWSNTIKNVRLTISAVRFADSKWTISSAELRKYRDSELYQEIERVFANDPLTLAGVHCRYCSANRTCNEARSWARKGATDASELVGNNATVLELETAYDTIKSIEAVGLSIRDEIEMRLSESGDAPQLLTWKAGRRVSSYSATVDEVIQHVGELTEDILYRPRKIRTKTALLKMFKHNEGMVEYIKSHHFQSKKGAEQFVNLISDTSTTLADRQLKTKIQLEDIFNDVTARQHIEKYDVGVLAAQLKPFIDSTSLISQRLPVSIPTLRKLVGEDVLSGITNTTQTQHIG